MILVPAFPLVTEKTVKEVPTACYARVIVQVSE